MVDKNFSVITLMLKNHKNHKNYKIKLNLSLFQMVKVTNHKRYLSFFIL